MMVKERIGLKDTLGLSPKVGVKKTDVDVEKTEKAVQKIHSNAQPEATTKVELTRLSIDMDKALFRKMKVKLAQEGRTVREYVLELIRLDLSK